MKTSQVVSQNIRSLRGPKTQQQISQKAKISISFLNDIEKQRRSCSLDTLDKLAMAFGTSVQYLVTRHE